MNSQIYNIKIINEKFGVLLDEKFINDIQFKLFLKAVHGSLELKNSLTFFNGIDFLIHIPYSILIESIITTENIYDMTEVVKSKIEALVTK